MVDSSLAFRKLSKILPRRVFGLGDGVGVGFGFGVAECFATGRLWTVGDASGVAVGDGGTPDEFPSRSSEAEVDSSTFGDSVGAADSTGLGEATGIGLGVGIDPKVGLGSGTTVWAG